MSSKARYDWSDTNFASANRFLDRNQAFNVSLEQIFLESSRQTLAAQVAWFREANERFSRNLIGMGIVPLQFKPPENLQALGLSGFESFSVAGISDGLQVGKELTVSARDDGGKVTEFKALCRIDTPAELDYYRHGGILEYVLRGLLKDERQLFLEEEWPKIASRILRLGFEPGPDLLDVAGIELFQE